MFITILTGLVLAVAVGLLLLLLAAFGLQVLLRLIAPVPVRRMALLRSEATPSTTVHPSADTPIGIAAFSQPLPETATACPDQPPFLS